MRILLLGEYSNVHWTLAEGLRQLGHQVTVASNGDFWKDYPRDVDLARQPGHWGGLKLMAKVCRQLPVWRGYDIVQLINPMFLELKAERLFPIYRYLRRHNKKMVLGAFGMDWYWVHTCTFKKPLRYSDFNIGDTLRNDEPAQKERADWLGTTKEKLNQWIATDCDAIVTGLYEYDVCYRPFFPEKTQFIPYPIILPDSITKSQTKRSAVTIFIGISRGRSQYKGTDIMLKAAQDLQSKYKDRMQLNVAEGVPFAEYQQMMDGSDAILDQLYSYTPSMNPLMAMSKGIVCIGGGEPENYAILGEQELRPIINVEPTYESVYQQLEQFILHPERIEDLKHQSVKYVRRHHDYLKVARQYETLYNKL
jgi:glycosyltransferase involved in cell wall biosynthesis